MKSKIAWIIVLVVFIFLLIVANAVLKQNGKESDKTKTGLIVRNSIEESTLKEINSANFEEEVLNNSKITLIDFYADWCPPCKKLSPIIEELAKERKDINFVRINVDFEENLANKYGIVSIPTLIVIKDGKEVDRSIGLIEKNKIEEILNH